MENTEKKVETKIDKGIDLSLLNIITDDEAEQEEFIKTDITMYITSYKLNVDNPLKCQLQNKSVDVLGNLQEQTFTVVNDTVITDKMMAKYLNKTVEALDVNRYVSAIKGFDGSITGEEVNYGAEFKSLKIVEDNVEAIVVNDYVVVDLTSVANKMKKDKATGSVTLTSISKDGTSLRTFSCLFDNKELQGHKLDRSQFDCQPRS